MLYALHLLLFGVKIVYGMESDTCQCNDKIEVLEKRIAYLENLAGVIRFQSEETEYVLVTAGGDPYEPIRAKFSVIDLKSPSFNCEIKIDMEDYEGQFSQGAGGVLNNDTVVLCGMEDTSQSQGIDASPKCIRLAKDSKTWVRKSLNIP